MLFTSAIFLLLFLPITLLGYQLSGKFGRRGVILWLALASLVFYSYWNPKFVLILLGSVILNYGTSRAIAKAADEVRKKQWMIFGIAANILVLCYFKYLFPVLGFLHGVGLAPHTWGGVVLPLGISFFTFTQIAYLVDLSQGEATEQSFVEYLLFVTIFPHLIAGPILHHREIMPQLRSSGSYRLKKDDFLVGLSWFIFGLAKKAVLADQIGPVADSTFRSVSLQSPASAWVGVLSYSLQLYFDFSGYSDMAVGLARMFSLQFPLNFNSPYKATSIIDFWARWHITLTRYLTLYLYNPISLAIRRRRIASGRKVSNRAQQTVPGFLVMVATPTFVTMSVAGVWHGAGFQFLIFGVLHGCYLAVNHAWRILRPKPANKAAPSAIKRAACLLLTYGCVLIGQIFFRANSTKEAIVLLGRLAGVHQPLAIHPTLASILPLIALFPVVWFMPNTQEILDQVPSTERYKRVLKAFAFDYSWAWTAVVGFLFFVALLFTSNSATFLYFQF